jgi:hypothetical protein
MLAAIAVRSLAMSKSLRVPAVLTLLVTLLLVACGDGKPKASANKIAAAFENQVDPHGNAKQAEQDMRQLKEKVAADAEAATLAEIDRVTVPAADAPTDLKAACEAMRGAYDAFVQKRLTGNQTELERWGVMKGVDLDKAVEACMIQSPKVAACQQAAFAGAGPTIGRDREAELLSTCIKKFGNPLAVVTPPPAGPIHGKKRPQG